MDLIDKGILLDLIRNCRITYRELSIKHGITANAIRNRIRNLEKDGVISAYKINFSSGMDEREYVYGVIKSDGSQDDITFVENMGQCPGVVAAAAYTGGVYYFVAHYRTPEDLVSIRKYMTRLESVKDLEIHTIITGIGEKIKLSKYQKRIIRVLLENPRMTIAEIADRARLTAKRVRKNLRKLEESSAVRFSVEIELGAASGIPFILEIEIDDQVLTYYEIEEWFRENHNLAFWEVYCAALEPKLFALLAVDTLTELNDIIRDVRKQSFAKNVISRISTYHSYFPEIEKKKILELTKLE
ncbi:MAG: winged helix-turn-helix transcriptional regulator [Candidatus Lokiarchaeota archaeon]|nr:winged helix-turn-helix transcriptional regulator [Candidatus Lokiarchaeota archaeon]